MGPMKLIPFCGQLSIFGTHLMFKPNKLYPKNDVSPELFRIDIDKIQKIKIRKIGLSRNMYIEVLKSSAKS